MHSEMNPGAIPSRFAPRDAQSRRDAAATAKRFLITVLVATVLHAAACILVPPFEFAPTRAKCFLWACRSGIVAFPIAFAILLLPLRAGLRRLLPGRGRAQAIAAALALFVLVAARILARQLPGIPAPPFEHGYVCQWIFWTIFAAVIATSFFWPFDKPATRAQEKHPQPHA